MVRFLKYFLYLGIIISCLGFIASSCSYSQQLQLREQYNLYKKHYMSQDGRIMDPDRNNITTSEGQAYMLLRSVIMNDKPTFNLVLKWSDNNLRREDSLYSWLWGENDIGQYKILDYNNASDASIDIAFALILAYEKWKDITYLNRAKEILTDIWDKQIVTVGGKKILATGVEQAKYNLNEFNPSYFSPYAMKKFQKYDKVHDWDSVVDGTYYYLIKASSATSTGLPPNFFKIENGNIIVSNDEKGDFSYDAIRVFGRVLLDYKITEDKRALIVLSKVKFFINKWQNGTPLYTNYKANGVLRDKDVFVGSVAMIYPAIKIYNPKVANEIYQQEIAPYLVNQKYWESKTDYYGKNLLWFGEYIDEIK